MCFAQFTPFPKKLTLFGDPDIYFSVYIDSFYYAVHKPGKCERQIKEKLKQIGAQMFPTELEADRYFRFSDR